ncbi:hypothetical protein SAMN05421664_3469 [Chryseobacterium soldanellicola]|uniref:DUF3828 domain-containing protein n=1 Tax=Chryseobacterium soldanellicola TaxID=311333 RepID=A0A1H1G6L5_9FLAO|nr:hypothetical protein [Chryseobacterium soldanellicola]SDR08568.1 hypothetical protein SAMN05421664_3469 [Chryseobacterium soldanellicola]
MKQLLFCLSIFLLFTGCKKSENHPKNFDADKKITEKLEEFYRIYGKSSDAIYNQPIPKNLFSSDLEKTFQKAIDLSKTDIKKVKKSDHPGDKPLLLEGSIFTSLYEGFTDYKIVSIVVLNDSKPLESSATVIVELKNTHYPNAKWTDIIRFINFQESGWKIDNVVFSKKMSQIPDVKTSLQNFISEAKK